MIFIVEIMNFRHLGIFKVYTKERRKLNDDVLWKWDNWKWNDYFYNSISYFSWCIFHSEIVHEF